VPKANARVISFSFFIAVINGLFTLNLIRILFNTCFAPKVAMSVAYNDDGINIDGSDPDYGCCANTFVSPDAINIIRDMLMVNEIMESSFIGEGTDEKNTKRNEKRNEIQDNEKGPSASPNPKKIK
jgi:hypothetical protein